MKSCIGVAALAVGVCFVVGCSGSGFPDPVGVSGKVTYQGEPVDGATVSFLTKDAQGRSASGKTDAQGEFKLTTFSTNDGAIPGEYAVTITKVESEVAADDIDIAGGDDPGDAYGRMMDAAAEDATMASVQEAVLPNKYSDAGESGLTRTVAAQGGNRFEFDLE